MYVLGSDRSLCGYLYKYAFIRVHPYISLGLCMCSYIYIYIIQQFSLKYVAFESTLLNFYAKPLRNWTFQRFVRAA